MDHRVYVTRNRLPKGMNHAEGLHSSSSPNILSSVISSKLFFKITGNYVTIEGENIIWIAMIRADLFLELKKL